MRISEQQRLLIETALDLLAGRAAARKKPTPSELRIYERAAAIVREMPAGFRRVRSDLRRRRARKDLFPVAAETLNEVVDAELDDDFYVTLAETEAPCAHLAVRPSLDGLKCMDCGLFMDAPRFVPPGGVVPTTAQMHKETEG